MGRDAVQVFARIDASCALADVAQATRRIEALGYDGVQVSETVHDPFVVAAFCIANSSRLVVRTSVALAFIRSPLLTAYAAWDLSGLSAGRFQLGLGTQVRQHIEDRYGMGWSRPVERMREYIGVLGTAFAAFRTGSLVPFDGTHYRLRRLPPYFNPGPDEKTVTPPIWLGGVGPRMCQLAGELAAGFTAHSTNSHPRYIRERCLPNLAEGAAAAGRDVTSIPLVAGACFVTGRDRDELAASRPAQRRKFAFLYSTPAYRPTLELCGYPGLPEELRRLVRRGEWDALGSVVTDEVLDEIQPAATYDELPALVTRRLSGLVSGFVLPPPDDPADDARFRKVVAAIQAIE
jgi:probable F420-dependent oxidoreductase